MKNVYILILIGATFCSLALQGSNIKTPREKLLEQKMSRRSMGLGNPAKSIKSKVSTKKSTYQPQASCTSNNSIESLLSSNFAYVPMIPTISVVISSSGDQEPAAQVTENSSIDPKQESLAIDDIESDARNPLDADQLNSKKNNFNIKPFNYIEMNKETDDLLANDIYEYEMYARIDERKEKLGKVDSNIWFRPLFNPHTHYNQGLKLIRSGKKKLPFEVSLHT